MPRGSQPCPMTLMEFQERFGTDDACREHLFQIRWGDGFRCPRCEGSKGYVRRDRPLIECGGCGYPASATAGTIFHRSHAPLRKWYLAVFLNAQSKRGISSLELSKQIGVRQATAWTMLHKIRKAMQARDALYTLGGIVDLDDAYFGGVKHGKVGRGTTRVKAVVALSMDEGNHPKHAKIVVVPDFTQQQINNVAKAIAEPGTTIRTDAMGGFGALSDVGFGHDIIPTVKLLEDTSPFPDVHMLISNIKAWMLGTFHGLGPKHMQAYLAEFVYRFNRRRLEYRLFERLLTACVLAPHTPVSAIVAG